MRIAIRESLAEIFRLHELGDRFLQARAAEVLDEVPRIFGHVPSVMEAYGRFVALFESRLRSDPHPWMTRDIKLREYATVIESGITTHEGFWWSVNAYVKPQMRQLALASGRVHPSI